MGIRQHATPRHTRRDRGAVSKWRETKLRKYARGEDCLVRGPTCNGDPETTVLAHLRVANLSGMGHKPPDLVAVLACSSCHDYIDQRTPRDMPYDDWILLQYQALARTLAHWQESGKVKVA